MWLARTRLWLKLKCFYLCPKVSWNAEQQRWSVLCSVNSQPNVLLSWRGQQMCVKVRLTVGNVQFPMSERCNCSIFKFLLLPFSWWAKMKGGGGIKEQHSVLWHSIHVRKQAELFKCAHRLKCRYVTADVLSKFFQLIQWAGDLIYHLMGL